MRPLYVVGTLLLLAGCSSSYATGSVKPTTAAVVNQHRDPATVMITENDITTRPYEVVGEVNASVRKTTIFDPDPTREKVNEAMQIQAVKLGADAVILARYGTVGIDLMSWGRLDGSGRAVRFAQ
jgi:uncharacterized lipoprotein YajG